VSTKEGGLLFDVGLFRVGLEGSGDVVEELEGLVSVLLELSFLLEEVVELRVSVGGVITLAPVSMISWALFLVFLRFPSLVGRTNSWTREMRGEWEGGTFFLFVAGGGVCFVEHGGGFEELLHGVGVSLVKLLGVQLDAGLGEEEHADRLDEVDSVLFLVDDV
jgi:hypothetical protein